MVSVALARTRNPQNESVRTWIMMSFQEEVKFSFGSGLRLYRTHQTIISFDGMRLPGPLTTLACLRPCRRHFLGGQATCPGVLVWMLHNLWPAVM